MYRKDMEEYNFSCQFTADLIAMNTAGQKIQTLLILGFKILL